MAKLLVIDNYDSFTHNLIQMFMQYDLDISVYRCDKISVAKIARLNPDYLLISPGPGGPADAGISISTVKAFAGRIPILGVCLGMQCINDAMGGQTIPAPVPVHGKTSRIYHFGQSLFKGMPSPFIAARYHSLIIKPGLKKLTIIAKSDDGIIMGIAHTDAPVFGLQFHPESFMTDDGFILIENFLRRGPLKNRLGCITGQTN
ncbi:MAG: anthranilate synthase component II [Dissulfuribacterales bacterium]